MVTEFVVPTLVAPVGLALDPNIQPVNVELPHDAALNVTEGFPTEESMAVEGVTGEVPPFAAQAQPEDEASMVMPLAMVNWAVRNKGWFIVKVIEEVETCWTRPTWALVSSQPEKVQVVSGKPEGVHCHEEAVEVTVAVVPGGKE